MTTYTYTTLNDPLSTNGTFASGINDAGQIVGYYNIGTVTQSFLYSGGTYTTLNAPSASETNAYGINATGQIVGYYFDGTGPHAFLYSGGTYTTLDGPSATDTYAYGINATGQIAGYYNIGTATQSFLYTGGAYSDINDPLAAPNRTAAQGINDAGQIVGYYYDGSAKHGFLYSGGTYTTLNVPSAIDTYARGINDAGQVVGYYYDGSADHGFLYSDGTYTTIDDPLGTNGTFADGINDKGQIVGFYNDGTGTYHSFLADPNPIMSDALKAHGGFTTLNGTSVGDGTVSVYDGTKLIGTVSAASNGAWSLQVHLATGTIHSFTEKATDLQGNAASSAGVTLYSTSQNKALIGGSGDDVLIGAPGDKLTGGAGAGTFVFNPKFGKETVTDFNVNQDVLAFQHTLFANATPSQVLSQAHDSKAGAVIVVDAHDTVTLTGVSVAQLQTHLNDIHFF